MYALGAAPRRLTSEWPSYNAAAGELLELIYFVPGGTAGVNTAAVKSQLNRRPGVSTDWVRIENASQVRARIRMLQPGKLGPVLGRYVVAGSKELDLRIVEVVGSIGAVGAAVVRVSDAVATQAGDLVGRGANVVGGVVNATGDAAAGVLGGLRWSLPVAAIALGGLYMFLRMGPPPRRAAARRRTPRRRTARA